MGMKSKIIFTFWIVSVLMTSCATIVNRPYKYVTVHTTEPGKIIYGQDTINTIDNKVQLKVERNDKPLSIVATTDSLTKSINIESEYSIMYWANICFNCGIGMLIDMKSPKRYSYPDRIYINPADAKEDYSIYGQANNKGELYLHLSLPLINSLLMMPGNEGTKVKAGIGGVTAGLDYYHSKKQFIHADISGLSGGFTLKDSKLESMTSDYISFSNNHKIGRFAIGYGFSFAKNTWNEYYLSSWLLFVPAKISEKSHYALGLIFPGYFQLGEYFNIGIVYRPTFYRPDMPGKFVYEHLISIDLALKIRLKK
jgi:hypothetical protein